MEKGKGPGEKPSRIISIVLFIGALIYTIAPFDIIPDAPVVGWIDDILLTLITGLNLI